MNKIPSAERPQSPGQTGTGTYHDLDRQRLRILRCTAHAMASSPGGLRFKRGSRPWLDDLPASVLIAGNRQHLRPDTGLQAALA